LRDRPIRTKLAIILLLPVLAILVLTGVSVLSAANRAADAGRARDLVAVGNDVAQLNALMQAERAAAALVFAQGDAAANNEYADAVKATDAAVSDLRAELARITPTANLAPLLDRITSDLDGLPALREYVIPATPPPAKALLSIAAFRYRAVIADLISYRQALGQVAVSPETANGLRATAALSAATEAYGQLQVAAVRVLAAHELTPSAQQVILGASTSITEAMQSFNDLSPAGWPAQLNSRLSGEQVLLSERLQGLVTRSEPGGPLLLGTDAKGQPIGAAAWSSALGARIGLMHAVESDLDADMLAAVTSERDTEVRTVLTSLSIVAALLVVVIVIGVVVARSLTGSLTRLQQNAIDVATRRLPEMVKELNVDNADPATVERVISAAAKPIPASGADEVGRVADSFNRVTSSAVRIAGEQAALRAGVGAILVSLSRRLQLRVDSMMLTLDSLEQRETSTDRLEKLFALDHVAVLIRRLIVNLQVLAGGRGGRPRTGGVGLADIVRAAGQEIDAYTRVAAAVVDESVEIRGEFADDLIHLLAEVLDNATRFSPPNTQVRVEAKRVGDLLYIQVRDNGTGMSVEDLDLARDRVAHPHRLDHRTTQHMGLPVVGAIAQRLKIKVEFRSTLRQGTSVDLTVPPDLIARRHAAMNEVTVDLPVLTDSGRRARPAVTAPPRVAAVAAKAAPLIFDELWTDPSKSWFRSAPSDDGQRVPVSAGWHAAAEAARHAGSAAPDEWTESGLPVRQPGQRVVPAVVPLGEPTTGVRRQPDQLRRQMSAFQHGLGLAGRRQVKHEVRRTTQP
jgi:signal transduction histidine kinase